MPYPVGGGHQGGCSTGCGCSSKSTSPTGWGAQVIGLSRTSCGCGGKANCQSCSELSNNSNTLTQEYAKVIGLPATIQPEVMVPRARGVVLQLPARLPAQRLLGGPVAEQCDGVFDLRHHEIAVQCSDPDPRSVACRGRGPAAEALFESVASVALRSLRDGRATLIRCGWELTAFRPTQMADLGIAGLAGIRFKVPTHSRPTTPSGGLGQRGPGLGLRLNREREVFEMMRAHANPSFIVGQFDSARCGAEADVVGCARREDDYSILWVNPLSTVFTPAGNAEELRMFGVHEMFHGYQKALALCAGVPLMTDETRWVIEGTADAAAKLALEPNRIDWSVRSLRDWRQPLWLPSNAPTLLTYNTSNFFQFVGQRTSHEQREPHAYLSTFLQAYLTDQSPTQFQRLDNALSLSVGLGLEFLYLESTAFWTNQPAYSLPVGRWSPPVESLSAITQRIGFNAILDEQGRAAEEVTRQEAVILQATQVHPYTTFSVFFPVERHPELTEVRVKLNDDLDGISLFPDCSLLVDGNVNRAGVAVRMKPKEHLGFGYGVVIHVAYTGQVASATWRVKVQAVAPCGDVFDPGEAQVPTPAGRRSPDVLRVCIPRRSLNPCGAMSIDVACCSIQLSRPDEFEVEWAHDLRGHPCTVLSGQRRQNVSPERCKGRLPNTGIFMFVTRGPDNNDSYTTGSGAQATCFAPVSLTTVVTATLYKKVFDHLGNQVGRSFYFRYVRNVEWTCCYGGANSTDSCATVEQIRRENRCHSQVSESVKSCCGCVDCQSLRS